jgi:hypothetical protein
MRKFIYWLIMIAVSISACTGSSPQPLSIAEPIQEESEPLNPVEVEPTYPPPQRAPTATPEPDFTPLSASPYKSTPCSSLALERSILLTKWNRGVVGQALIPYDPELGSPLCDFKPIAVGKNNFTAISPDGNLLAYAFTEHDDFHDGRLYFVDLRGWADIPTTIEINSWIAGMAFSPDGSRLVIAHGMPEGDMMGWPKNFTLLLVDVNNRAILTETTLDMAVSLLSFTAGGESLMLYGVRHQESSGLNGEAHALVLDAGSLEIQWDRKLEDVIDGQTRLYTSDNTEIFVWWGPGVVLSPVMEKLFIVHADADRLTSVDFTQRTVGTVDIHPQVGWFERLLAMFAGVAHAKELEGTQKQAVLSPDGDRLYVVGRSTEAYQDSNNQTQYETTFLGLQVIDPTSGAEIAHLDSDATNLVISPDGTKLFLHGWDNLEWTDVLDAQDLEIDRRVTNRTLMSVRRLDGEPVIASLISGDGVHASLAVFDPETLEQKEVWSVGGSAGLLMP